MNTETQFNYESKDLPTFMVSGYAGGFTESSFDPKDISDEEVEEAAKNYHRNNGGYYAQIKTFIDAVKWYRQQLENIS